MLLCLIGALFYTLPSGYWRADDPAILFHAMHSKGLSAFYDPADWQKLSPSNLTPWLTFSFKLDLWAFGLSPKPFYLHSLFSLGLVGIAAYVLNRLWMPPVWSLLCVALFLIGAPTASVVELLMTRHYLEGLLLALLSVIAFVHAVRMHSMRWALAGALAYALAATAKEIYVPLVLVVLFIPPLNSLPSRLRLAAPYFAVATLYVLWRQYMLGAMVGGYADTKTIFSMQSVTGMLAVLSHFPAFLIGPNWHLPTLLASCALALSACKKPRGIPVILCLCLCVSLPLFPLIAFPGISAPDRYLFLFWFVASFAYVFALSIIVSAMSNGRATRNAVGYSLVLAMGVFVIPYTTEVRKSNAASFTEFDVQGRFYFEAGEREGFIPTAGLLHGYWYVTNFCDIKKVLGMGCPVALIAGVPEDKPIDHLFAYDSSRGSMSETTRPVSDERSRLLLIDASRPLFAAISVEQSWARWKLGPYEGGQYYFASPEIGRYSVSRDGVLKTPLKHLAFYVQYESPEGWSTSSPLLVVGGMQPVAWQRSATK